MLPLNQTEGICWNLPVFGYLLKEEDHNKCYKEKLTVEKVNKYNDVGDTFKGDVFQKVEISI